MNYDDNRYSKDIIKKSILSRNSYESSSQDSLQNINDTGSFDNIKDLNYTILNSSYLNDGCIDLFIDNLNIKLILLEPEDLSIKNFKDKLNAQNDKWEVQIESELKVYNYSVKESGDKNIHSDYDSNAINYDD